MFKNALYDVCITILDLAGMVYAGPIDRAIWQTWPNGLRHQGLDMRIDYRLEMKELHRIRTDIRQGYLEIGSEWSPDENVSMPEFHEQPEPLHKRLNPELQVWSSLPIEEITIPF